MSDKIKIVYSAVDDVTSTLKKITGSMDSSLAKWQSNNKKVRASFVNLNTDVNRASASTSSFNKVLGRLGGTVAGISGAWMLANVIKGTIQSSMDAIEVTNLFNVSLGEMSAKAEETVQSLNKLYGLDPTNLRSAIGTYAMMARSMGMSVEQGEQLATVSARLALDMASLGNTTFAQAMQDLRSGLVGQSETMYKYGVDVTEAALKEEAMRQGITKSVRAMGQGEKMALRLAVTYRQTALAQGDLARTINQPANQLRVLQDRFTTLSRTIGNIFIPVLSKILPYVNAVVMVITELANAIANFFGYEASEVAGTGTSGFSGIADDAEDATGAIGGATSAAKKFKNALMGIDEINVLSKQDDASGGGGGGGISSGSSILDQIKMPTLDQLMGDVTSQADLIKEKIKNAFAGFKLPQIDGINLAYQFKALRDELEKFGSIAWGYIETVWNEILVPILEFAVDDALPRFFTTLRIALSGFNDELADDKDTFDWFVTDILSPIGKFTAGRINSEWDEFNQKLQRQIDLVKEIKRFFQDLGDYIITNYSSGGELFNPFANWTIRASSWGVQNLINDFMELVATIKGYGEKFVEVKNLVTLKIDEMKIKAGELWTNIKLGAGDAWTAVKKAFSNMAPDFGDSLDKVKTSFSKAWDSIKLGASKAWESLKKGFSFDGKFMSGIATGISSAFRVLVNAIIRGINNVMATPFHKINGFLNNIKDISILGARPFGNLWNYNPIRVPYIPQFASGGFPDDGQLFLAREAGAEMVGSMNGKTAVVNNDQIVESVSRGVSQAVSSVLGNQNNASGDLIFQIGITEFGRISRDALNAVGRQDGAIGLNV